LKNII